jgi:hypothetical protein
MGITYETSKHSITAQAVGVHGRIILKSVLMKQVKLGQDRVQWRAILNIRAVIAQSV